MGWYFWAPAVPFVVLFFTPLRWPAILASAAGVAAGLAAALTVGLIAWPVLGMTLLLNIAMAFGEGITASFVAGGRLGASLLGAGAAHGTLVYLVWRELSAGRWALAIFLIPAALLGGSAATVAARLSRS